MQRRTQTLGVIIAGGLIILSELIASQFRGETPQLRYLTMFIAALTGIYLFWNARKQEHQAEELAQTVNLLSEKEKTLQAQHESMLAAEEELRQNMEEMEAMQEQLKLANQEQEVRLKLINQAMGYVEYNIDGFLISANEAFAASLGYTLAEVQGKHHSLFCTESEKHSIDYRLHWERLRNGELISGEFERITKQGEKRYQRAFYAPVKNAEGVVVRVMKFAFDITDSKHQAEELAQTVNLLSEKEKTLQAQHESMLAAEEELRQNMEEMEAMQEQLKLANQEQEVRLKLINQAMGYVEYNIEGFLISANEAFAASLGYTLAEVQGKHHSLFCTESEKHSIDYRLHWERLRNGELISGEFERITKQGEKRYQRAFYAPVKNAEGVVVRVMKFAFDITESKHQAEELAQTVNLLSEKEKTLQAQHESMLAAEEELRQNMEEMEAMQEQLKLASQEQEIQMMALNACALVAETDIRGNITYVNDTFCQTSKYSREELMGKNHRILKSGLHEDAIYADLWKTISSGRVWQGEIANRAKDGSIYWVKSFILPVLDAKGIPIRYIVARIDITDLKLKEQDILQAKDELTQTVELLSEKEKEMCIQQAEIQEKNKILKKTSLELAKNTQALETKQEELLLSNRDLERRQLMDSTIAKFSMLMRWRSDHTLQTWSQDILEALVSFANGLQACLYMLDTEKEAQLKLVGCYSVHPENVEHIIPFGHGIVGQAALSKRYFLFNNPESITNVAHANLASVRPQALFVLPLIYNDHVEGILEVNTLQPFTEFQTDLLKHIGENIAANLVSVQNQVKLQLLFEDSKYKSEQLLQSEAELRKNLEEVKLMQTQMSEANSYQNSLLKGAGIAIITADTEGKVRLFNPIAEKMFGYTLTEVVHKKITTFFDSIELHKRAEELSIQLQRPIQPGLECLSARALSHNKETREWNMLKKNGETLITNVTFSIIWSEASELLGYLMMVEDISERKLLEKEVSQKSEMLQASEEELRQNLEELQATQEEIQRVNLELGNLLSSIKNSTFIVEMDANLVIQEANAEFTQFLGYKPSGLVNHTEEILWDPQNEYSFEAYKQKVLSEENVKGEIMFRKANGHTVHIYSTFNVLKNKWGDVYKVIQIAFDITQEVRQKVQLQQREKELNEINQVLELKVKERTIHLEQTLDELKTTQEQLVHNEKLASLGQLIASIAHEMNTPLGAVRGAVENMTDYMQKALFHLPVFYQDLKEEHQRVFNKWMSEISTQSTSVLNTREERQKVAELTQFLTQSGISDAKILAKLMIPSGLTQVLEEDLDVLRDKERAEKVLHALYAIAQIRKSVEIIDLAAAKTQKTVFALKNYAHHSNDGEAVLTDIVENIETVLTIYQGQLKNGIEVVKDFDNIGKIKAYPDELAQVWTNFIQNALHAMDNKGTLEIGVKKQTDGITVSFTDTGKGVPTEYQNKIFDAFFTTKAQGEGTGLGLSICKKIIEKHKGYLNLESEPGKTTFFAHIQTL